LNIASSPVIPASARDGAEVAERTAHLIGAVVEKHLGHRGRAVLRIRADELGLDHGHGGAADYID
jgi:hypothetical protein